jgi:alpha-1,6-mannosyltransferase
VPRELARAGGRAFRTLRLVAPGPLRVVDVALFYGERSGGIRTYVDAKRAVLRERADVEHHVVVPGPRERHDDGWHALPSLRIAAANGYRLPIGVRGLKATLRRLHPDVVLLHDPFWSVLGVHDVARSLGARVIAVHHGSCDLDAAGLPGPDQAWRPMLRAWFHHAYRSVDAVMSAIDPWADCGRGATLPLRFGVDPAFRPRAEIRREDHVLYVGRLAREKGVGTLLEAAARSAEPWTLELVGSGAQAAALAEQARRLGLARRVTFRPYEQSAGALARRYAAASCVVMPGPFETFGLVGLEAAASGARVVASATAPSVQTVGGLAHTFAPGDAAGLARAIDAARAAPRDLDAAAALAARCTWSAAIDAELGDVRRLVVGDPAPTAVRAA